MSTALIQVINKYQDQLKMALPKGTIDPSRVVRLFMTQVRRNPQLNACDPVSVLGAMVRVCQLGLDPERAYLIPFKKECNVIVDYRGLCDLARRSGEIKDIFAKTVYENDLIEVDHGSISPIKHKPDLFNPGKPVGFYARAIFSNGLERVEFMNVDQIQEHKKKYVRGRSDAWDSSFEEMAKKTVLRKLCKTLPQSTEVIQVMSWDDAKEEVSQENHLILDADHTPTYNTTAEATTIHKINSEEKSKSQAIEKQEVFDMIEGRIAELLGNKRMSQEQIEASLDINSIHDINDFDTNQLIATWEMLQNVCKENR